MSSMSLRIRRARTQVSLTQTELARRLGVQRSAVTQWERDDGTTPNVDHLAHIAKETGVCFEWIATGRGPSHPDGDAFVTAVIVQDYVRDELEGRVLTALRMAARRKRETIARVVELLAT
ncbi:MAG TPA: helix-turn-helix transcriptional regulator [Pyrinomonadaceae bacterium]|nr:helix-turn-helix transcriptional regulator [Pyrinomonadaceae bacterium]